MTGKEIKLIAKVVKNYRKISYGQFDQESSEQPEETADAAEALEFMIEEMQSRRFTFNNLLVLLDTMKVEIPESYAKELSRQNSFGI